jgi:hypothetical protein
MWATDELSGVVAIRPGHDYKLPRLSNSVIFRLSYAVSRSA